MYENPENTIVCRLCSQLITDILFAGSEEEVKEVVNAAFREIENDPARLYLMRSFVTMMMEELKKFDPMDKDAQQWSNIKLARIFFFRKQQTIENVQAGIV